MKWLMGISALLSASVSMANTEVQKALHNASVVVGVPVKLLSAVCYVESRHNPKAFRAKDGKSASYGMCQLKLATARFMGFTGLAKDLQDVHINAFLAAKYLHYQHTRYKSWKKAVSAYNAGHASNHNKPYVLKVMRLYAGQ